jgi:hypothetical protein
MKYRYWMGILGMVLSTAGGLAPMTLQAATTSSDGYSIEDFRLSSAGDLVDVCTLETGHRDHEVAKAFCYGFFEGAANYDDAISNLEWYNDIVCMPADATRAQAVAVYIDYIKANPQYESETPVDSIFRALVAKWPCPPKVSGQ